MLDEDASMFRRMKELFAAAREAPPERREIFLKERCPDDEALRARVLRLLDHADESSGSLEEGFLEEVTLSEAFSGGNPAAWEAFLKQVRELGPPTARFEDQGEVAQGGMGVIRRIRDRNLRRTLAMKVILAHEAATPLRSNASLGRFLEEAQVTSQLDHPGIVPVHDIGLDDQDRLYFTMKFVKGEDLRSMFDRVHDPSDDGWNETRALGTLLRVCEAMAYAHEKGVIHRDLKPANVMAGKHGQVYVMDWGLAKVLGREDRKDLRISRVEVSSLIGSERRDAAQAAPDAPLVTVDGDVVGTPAYMPPEQAEGRIEEMGPHSDVYALGAMLYHLLAGRMPYVNPGARVSARTILAKVLEGPPKPIHEIRKGIPVELTAICEKAMARRIGDRYADMTALAQDLRAFLENRVVAAHESGPIAELKKWMVRNKAVAATAAAALVAVLLLSIWALAEREAALANEQEVRARKAEFDQLAGVVHLEKALEKEKELYPAWPEKIEAMNRWLGDDAAKLAALKPTLRQTIEDLEARASQLTEEEPEQALKMPPRFLEMQALKRKVTSLRRAQEVREGVVEFAARPLSEELVDASAQALIQFAWPRIDPDESKRIFGEEREAIAAAERAKEKLDAGDTSIPEPMVLRTLAWARFANGLDAEALEPGRREEDPGWDQATTAYRGYREKIEAAIEEASGEAGRARLEALESQLQSLENEVAHRRTWSSEQESQRFLHETLFRLFLDIESFEENEKRAVEQRLAWAQQIGELTREHPKGLESWEDARWAIQEADGVVASTQYREHPIDLKPQIGLVPIGMNPVTKLWEFYHLRSAWDPSSGIDPATIEIPMPREDGSITVEDSTGIVFVLVPGATFLMGAQRSDPAALNFDPLASPDESPVHEVTLEPYFLARHELTKGQWARLGRGEDPGWFELGSTYDGAPLAIGRTHPVENVSWEMSRILLERHGLSLPTEAQWEHGARGGRDTPWWTGSDASTLQGAANVLDLAVEARYPQWGRQEGDFDDGFVSLSPVGAYRDNPFGLFDVHGNVWEWCRDGYGRYLLSPDEGDGLRDVEGDSPATRLNRGGSFYYAARRARSAFRSGHAEGYRSNNLGVRPARSLL